MIKQRYSEIKVYQLNGKVEHPFWSIQSSDRNPVRMVKIFKPVYERKGLRVSPKSSSLLFTCDIVQHNLGDLLKVRKI